jgi:hypothetical protein
MWSILSDPVSGVDPATAAAAAAVPVVVYLVYRVLFPSIDPREPPVLPPAIPFLGHILSLMREQNNMFHRL